MGNMGGIIFSFFTWGCVFAVLVDPEAKESAIYLQTKNSAENDQPVSSPSEDILTDLSSNIRLRYGPFWRRKVRLLLVTGEPEEAEAIAPGLTGQHWLEGDHTVLIYGGRPTAEPDVTLLTALKTAPQPSAGRHHLAADRRTKPPDRTTRQRLARTDKRR